MTDDIASEVIGSDDQTRSPARFTRLRPSRQLLPVVALSIAFLVVILAIWQTLVTKGVLSVLILPPPLAVASSFLHGVLDGVWWNDIFVTIEETVLGALLGGVAAILIGALFAYAEIIRRAAYPYLLAVQTFPKVALAPLLMAWLGYGLAPKVIISAMLAFFPVFSNTLAGFLEVDESSVELLRSMRATAWQELRYLRLPNAVAFILPSLDVALVLALLGAIASELAGGQAGLGQVIEQTSFQGDTAAVYAVLVLLAIIGMSLRTVTKTCLKGVRRAR